MVVFFVVWLRDAVSGVKSCLPALVFFVVFLLSVTCDAVHEARKSTLLFCPLLFVLLGCRRRKCQTKSCLKKMSLRLVVNVPRAWRSAGFRSTSLSAGTKIIKCDELYFTYESPVKVSFDVMTYI